MIANTQEPARRSPDRAGTGQLPDSRGRRPLVTTLSETQKRSARDHLRARGRSRCDRSFELARPSRRGRATWSRFCAEEASDLLGPGDELVGPAMPPGGGLDGQVILVFRQGSELALADLLLQQPIGTTTTFGELETGRRARRPTSWAART